MAIIKIDRFSGIRPKASADKLKVGEAQYFKDLLIEDSDLRPIANPVTIASYMPASTRRLFQWKDRWLAWISEKVRVVASPVPSDSFERIYWTRGKNGANDLPARFATRNELVGAVDMSNGGANLGIARPTNKPSFSSAPTTTTDEAAAITMSQTSPVRVTTAADHPFKDGQRVVVSFEVVSGSEPNPPPGVGMGEINGKEFVVRIKKNDATGIPDARVFDLIGANGANYSEYEPAKWQAKIMRVLTDSDMDSRSYVYTYVSQYGEESQPSDASDVVDVVKGIAVGLTLTGANATGYTGRLYRSITGPGGTNFFLVKDNIALGVPGAVAVTDDTRDESVGEMLPSETWAPPPLGLDGLTAMPNGFLAGFIGNTLYFCEPYQPHAWPEQYKRTVQNDIVGMAVYGQTLVVATKGRPYVASGADPSSVSLTQLDMFAPCLSAESVVSVGTGVVYQSGEGLIHASSSGVRNLTEGHMTASQWQAMTGEVITACWHDGRLFMGVTAGDSVVMSFGHDSLDIGLWHTMLKATAISSEPFFGHGRNAMVYAIGNGSLNVFERGADTLTGNWRGGVIRLLSPVSFACAQVFASDYPVTIEIHAARMTSGGQPSSIVYPSNDPSRQRVTVNGPEPFRLVGGFVAREWRIDVESKRRVQSVVLASSMDELRQV